MDCVRYGTHSHRSLRRAVPLLLTAIFCLFMIDQNRTIAGTQHFTELEEDMGEETVEPGWLVDARGAECHPAGRRSASPLPLTAFLSSPGSGNTWLRWMIEHLTGLCTGSVYHAKAALDKFPCEMDDVAQQTAIVYKTHYMIHFNSSKMLLLVRNPYEMLIAEYNRQMTGVHVGIADDKDFETPEWHVFVLRESRVWLGQIKLALAVADDVLVVFYDNLKKSLVEELRKISDFLFVRVDDARLQCTVRNSMGRNKRPKRIKPLHGIFTVEEQGQINDLIQQSYEVFLQFGIPDVPDIYLAPEIACPVPNCVTE